jgi:quinohemoprotein ethanol dehydrogenase
MRRRRLGPRAARAAVVTAIAVGTLVSLSAGAAGDTVSISSAPAFTPEELNATPTDNWLTAGGGLHDTRYSALTQISSSTIGKLDVNWVAHFGLAKRVQATLSEEAAPVVYQGVMYVADGRSSVYALDASTGAMLWKYKAVYGPAFKPFIAVNRGVAIGDGKVYFGQINGNITALDMQTGQALWSRQVGRWQEGYSMTSPTLYYRGMVIQGVSGGDVGARSFAVALDAKTGNEKWRWYVAPSPGELGSGTWAGSEWIHGGGAIWISPSVDPALNLLYLVTGNPVPWNGRGAGDNLWTDSIVALNVDTGAFEWGFQTVHHDIWDYDVTNPPVLYDAVYGGQMKHAIAVASKTGWVYILDRTNGHPLLPIAEKKVPQLKGAAARYANLARTQPYPSGQAFVNQCSKRKWWPGPAPDGKPYKVGCIFTPYAPTKQGSFLAAAPHAEGGVDWPPSAYNPTTGLMYLCARESAGFAIGAVPKKQQRLVVGQLYVGVNFGAGSKVMKDYGRIVAMDLKTNRIAWQVRWKQPCFSGMLTTAGGLVFAAESNTRRLHAYDAATGKLLWTSRRMVAGPNAPAITYTAHGKQYVAILAGGNSLAATKPGDSIYAFALP